MCFSKVYNLSFQPPHREAIGRFQSQYMQQRDYGYSSSTFSAGIGIEGGSGSGGDGAGDALLTGSGGGSGRDSGSSSGRSHAKNAHANDPDYDVMNPNAPVRSGFGIGPILSILDLSRSPTNSSRSNSVGSNKSSQVSE